MLHPNQFQVNAAWIAFKLNDAPIPTQSDGDLNFIALMDAASCFILSSAIVPASEPEPSKMEARRLLKEAEAHKQQFPRTLFIPSAQPANLLTVEAERQGITVIRAGEDELLPFIAEAREAFGEHFSGGSTQ